MTSILFFIVGIALGFYVKGKFFGGTGKTFASKSKDEMEDMRTESREALSERTEERKEKILEMMEKEEEHQKALLGCNLEESKKGITSNDVEELLDVSGQTACKYLNELEDEGEIEQIGSAGRGVYYILKGESSA